MSTERRTVDGARVKYLRSQRGLTQGQLAVKSGVEQSHISKIETGARVNIQLRIATKLAKALEVPLNAILLDSSQQQEPPRPPIDQVHASMVQMKRQLDTLLESLNVIPIPILGRVPAGLPLTEEADVLGYTYLPESEVRNRPLYALKVSGWSMKDADIEEGDLVIVDPSGEVVTGSIVVAEVNGEHTVKRWGKVVDNEITLQPENAAHKPLRCHLRDVRVLGVVIERNRVKRFA
jgi:SOS-response transcriptional repressor LexA